MIVPTFQLRKLVLEAVSSLTSKNNKLSVIFFSVKQIPEHEIDAPIINLSKSKELSDCEDFIIEIDNYQSLGWLIFSILPTWLTMPVNIFYPHLFNFLISNTSSSKVLK